jgi:hypothetical protein
MSARDDQALPASGPPASHHILALEREVLRALCQDAAAPRNADSRLLDTAARVLSRYRFRDIEHQMVFDILGELRPGLKGSDHLAATGPLKEHLLRRLTLLGFPDVNLDAYFAPQDLNPDEVLERMRTLARVPAT